MAAKSQHYSQATLHIPNIGNNLNERETNQFHFKIH